MLAPSLVMTFLVALLLHAQKSANTKLEWVVKPAASVTFVVTGFLQGGMGSTFGRVVVAGLCLAALGDVLLIPKDKRAFLAGLVAFLLGHVAYGAAFVVRGIDPVTTLAVLLAFTLVAIPVLRWLWPSVSVDMRKPVAAYIVVITIMVALSAGAARKDGAWLLVLGAVAFYLSDLSVARDRFVKKEFLNRAWGLPLYFFAQMILASQSGK
jgi:uncharacterized membrane protein YhhN